MASEPGQTKPNILVIMCDQMTASLTGVYGHSVVKTPHLNKLAESGIRFDAAYTSCPVCAPARASMMSGQYVSRIGTYDNGTLFSTDIQTFAHSLGLAGYETILSGKMHFIGPDQLHGFERRLTTDIYPSNCSWVADWERDQAHGIQNQKGYLAEEANPTPANTQLCYDEMVQARSLDFLRDRYTEIREKGAKRKPFCLVTSFTHPHTPFEIPQEYYDRYEGEEIDLPITSAQAASAEIEMDKWLRDYEGISPEVEKDTEQIKKMRRVYYAMISYIDDKVGELLKMIDQLGLRDNTAILFTSDHGEMAGERGYVEKRLFYESSARIPLIASFPKKWQQKVIVTDPVNLMDLCPTLIEIAQGEPIGKLDGTSLVPYFTDPEYGERDRSVMSEYHCEGSLAPTFMIRKGQYKYVMVHQGGSQLFDLKADPNELNNLRGNPKFSDIETSLRQRILDTSDPDAIKVAVLQSQKRCKLIWDEMKSSPEIHWDYTPVEDSSKKYVRDTVESLRPSKGKPSSLD
ncbi:MAG: choline-sulfatase [Opitutaceae bacterium]|nr:choline-sulfatase [Opitutaceae bacterium]